MLDMECPWSEPVSEVHAAHYGGCVEFPSAVNGSTGDWAEFLVFGGRDVTLYADEASWMDCNTTGSTTILEPVSKGGRDVMITFNQAGKYYLGSNGSCADGLKVIFSIEGETTNETNALSWADENVFAPDIAANATAGHEAFGKGVYHDRQYDAQLHTACEDDVCLDRNASRGSCYYAGEDFHIGHAVFCDVTEVECCGYVNCSSAEQGNRGKFQNGTSHDYYWYAPGFISGQSGCCHCAASCDFAAQDAAKAESGNEDACEYRDVSSPECQRAPSPWSLEYDTIGYLKCPFPEGTSFSDATVRETVSDE